MKLDLSSEIRNNVDSGDKESISFTFTVPQGLTDKTYNLALESEYDYRNGVYRQSSDESTNVQIKIIGCTPSSSSTRVASISASLESEARAGEDLVVSSRITNTDSKSRNFVVDATDYS